MFRLLVLSVLIFFVIQSEAATLQDLKREFVGLRGQVLVPARYISRDLGSGVREIRQAPDLIANLKRLAQLAKCRGGSVAGRACSFSLVVKREGNATAVYASGLMTEPDDCASCGLKTEVLFTQNGRDWFVTETGGFAIETVRFDTYVDGASILIASRYTQSGGGPLTVTVVATTSDGHHITHAQTIDPDMN